MGGPLIPPGGGGPLIGNPIGGIPLPCGCMAPMPGPPTPLTGPARPIGAADIAGTAIPRPLGIPLPGPAKAAAAAPSLILVSSAGGGPSTDRETTHSPLMRTSPRGRFSSLSSPFPFPLGTIFLNSSQSPMIRFMCLSKAMNFPIRVLLSWMVTLIL